MKDGKMCFFWLGKHLQMPEFSLTINFVLF